MVPALASLAVVDAEDLLFRRALYHHTPKRVLRRLLRDEAELPVLRATRLPGIGLIRPLAPTPNLRLRDAAALTSFGTSRNALYTPWLTFTNLVSASHDFSAARRHRWQTPRTAGCHGVVLLIRTCTPQSARCCR